MTTAMRAARKKVGLAKFERQCECVIHCRRKTKDYKIVGSKASQRHNILSGHMWRELAGLN